MSLPLSQHRAQSIDEGLGQWGLQILRPKLSPAVQEKYLEVCLGLSKWSKLQRLPLY